MAAFHPGSCHCGAVRFEAVAPLRDVLDCDCTQCRRWSGRYWSATSVPMDRFRLTEDRGRAWYRASGIAERGFCRDCGSSHWVRDTHGTVSVAGGSVVGASGGKLTRDIHVGNRGDLSIIVDGLPQLGSGD